VAQATPGEMGSCGLLWLYSSVKAGAALSNRASEQEEYREVLAGLEGRARRQRRPVSSSSFLSSSRGSRARDDQGLGEPRCAWSRQRASVLVSTWCRRWMENAW